MAATKRTVNKLKHARYVIYWLAQIQRDCHYCRKPLVNGHISDTDDLTVDHISGTYDHAKRQEAGKCKGGRLMHSLCHRRMTCSEKKIWKHRNALTKNDN